MRAGDDMPREPRAPRARRPGRGRVLLVILAIGLFIFVTTLRSVASFYTDYLWFKSIDQTGVWRGVLGTKLTLAFVFIGDLLRPVVGEPLHRRPHRAEVPALRP